MAFSIENGSRVSVFATYFDGKNTDNAWSKSIFGDDFNTTRCLGTCILVSKGDWVLVKWDLDGKNSRVKKKDLLLVSQPSVINNNSQPRNENELLDNLNDSSSDSSSSSESSSSSSDSTINNNDENSNLNEENLVTAHGLEWTFGVEVLVDMYKDAKYKPQLHVGNISVLKEIDMWMLFFPSENINHILACTNASLPEKKKPVSKGEIYKVIGILYGMSLQVLHSRREYWGNEEGGVFPAPSFGRRFGMGYHRFEQILSNLYFAMPNENNDLWWPVRTLVNMTMEKWRDVFSPGYKLTVDESMFAWYGLGNTSGGLPAVIKIKRKPKGVGCECKTIADVQSGIMIGLEINEGKNAMQTKHWQKDLGAGTATSLRLTEPWHGSGRIVIGDSWFASVKTSIELHKRGLYFIGIVKTATKMFPLLAARDKCPEERGKIATAIAETDGIKLTCVAWRDKKIHSFVGTCGTTLEGEPAKKRRRNAQGQPIIKEVPRPKIVEQYFEGAPAIDIHNHIRQDGLALEQVWNTQRWHHRIYGSIFGIIETNAYLAYNYFKLSVKQQKVDHATFTEALAMQLIFNPWLLENNPQLPLNQMGDEDNNPGDHVLQSLSTTDVRKRVQRKCVIVLVYTRGSKKLVGGVVLVKMMMFCVVQPQEEIALFITF